MASQAQGSSATTLAVNIRSARVAAGLTQRGLADAVGVDQMIVSKWERGRHRPSPENVERLAAHFGVPVAWLYTEHEAAA